MSSPCLFKAWFDANWKRKAETQAAAAGRLGAKAGVAGITVIRALGGNHVGGATAVALSRASRGIVPVEALVRRVDKRAA